MTAEIDDIRFGLIRALRKMRQDFSSAIPRSTGAGVADSARLTVCLVGKDRDALTFADPDDPVSAGCSEVVRTAGQCG